MFEVLGGEAAAIPHRLVLKPFATTYVRRHLCFPELLRT